MFLESEIGVWKKDSGAECAAGYSHEWEGQGEAVT